MIKNLLIASFILVTVIGFTFFFVLKKVPLYLCDKEATSYARKSLQSRINAIKRKPSLDSIPEKTVPLYEDTVEKGQFLYTDYNPNYESCLQRFHVQFSRAEKYDKSREADFENIKKAATSYYKNLDETPKTIKDIENAVFPSINVNDPENEKPYTFQMISDEDAEVCMTFSTESPLRIYKEYEERGVSDVWSARVHKKGYQCKRLIVALGYKRNEFLQNGDFSSWGNYSYGSEPQYWHFSGKVYPVLQEIGINDPSSVKPSGLVAVLPAQANAKLISESFNATEGNRYRFSIWVKPGDLCVNCGYLGFEMQDEYNESLLVSNLSCSTDIVTSTSSSKENLYYSYITPGNQKENGYMEYSYTCLLPSGAKRLNAVFGYVNAPGKDWVFDNVSIKKL